MKKSIFVYLGVFLICIGTGSAFGASKKKKEAPVIHHPVIASVTATSITVTEEKTTKTLTINQFTEINVNGQRATVADLKPGMGVSVTLGADATKASRINATGAPK